MINITEEMFSRSVLNAGNPYRLTKLFEKSANGEEITLVVIGGSVTQQFNASPETCYGAVLRDWLKETFPKAKVNLVNSGIGASGSLIGVHRIQRDVLNHNPDMVVVEFCVNEPEGDLAKEAYDNLIHRILNHNEDTAVVCLGLMTEWQSSAQNSHLPVAEHYDIPFISYKQAIIPEIENGRLKWSELANDGVHPIDAGHRLAADLIINHIAKVLNKESKNYEKTPCKTPLVSTKYENAYLYQMDDVKPLKFGCFKREEVNLICIKEGFVARENGEPFEIEFKNCNRVYVLFGRFNDCGNGVIEGLGNREKIETLHTPDWVYYSPHLVCESEGKTNIKVKITPELEKEKRLVIAGFLVS